MKQIVTLLGMLMLFTNVQAQKTITVKVTNPARTDRVDAPVVIPVKECGLRVKSALVTIGDVEIPCQLDDLDGDHVIDELCFLTSLKKYETKRFSVQLLPNGKPRKYPDRTFAELMLRNPKVTIKNKHDIFMKEMTVLRNVDPYAIVHHHGVAFESELIAMRIYFDHRQTVDLYGKRHKALEVKDTQFYPDEQQLAAGYGDDVLWCGTSFGLGALRGWDGEKQTMLEDVESRTQKVITYGPVRTIVELRDEQWIPSKGMEPVDMQTRYTIYGGHRDCAVDITFDRDVSRYRFATGIVNVEGSIELSNHDGLRGCWGTAWAVSGKDTLTHQRETVGLGICIPKQHIVSEEPANPVDYGFVISTSSNKLHYDIVYCSDKEDFGYHSSSEWFAFLKEWGEEVDQPVVVTVEE